MHTRLLNAAGLLLALTLTLPAIAQQSLKEVAIYDANGDLTVAGDVSATVITATSNIQTDGSVKVAGESETCNRRPRKNPLQFHTR